MESFHGQDTLFKQTRTDITIFIVKNSRFVFWDSYIQLQMVKNFNFTMFSGEGIQKKKNN